jgi:hypothetical protein
MCVLALLIQRAVEIRTGETWRNVRHELQQIEAVCYRIGRRTIAGLLTSSDDVAEDGRIPNDPHSGACIIP